MLSEEELPVEFHKTYCCGETNRLTKLDYAAGKMDKWLIRDTHGTALIIADSLSFTARQVEPLCYVASSSVQKKSNGQTKDESQSEAAMNTSTSSMLVTSKRRRDSEEAESIISVKETKIVNSFITSSSSKVNSQFEWNDSRSNLWIAQYKNPEARSKIAGLDLDFTLITPKSGNRWPRDEYDWRWLFGNVPKKLRELYNDGYKLVIITNQAGLNTSDKKTADKRRQLAQAFKRKLERILTNLDVPCQVLIATKKDEYRKPVTGTWHYLEEHGNNGVEIDRDASFYVGDAAGRVDNWKPDSKKDFECTDRKFAANLKIKFHTPEAFFLGIPETNSWTWGKFNPKPYTMDSVPITHPSWSRAYQELVLFVGAPASGKSTFYANHFAPEKYEHVNQDTLGSIQKCLKIMTSFLDQKRSVVVDNTNPERGTRAHYISIAKQRNIPVRCLFFTADLDLCLHNNAYRAIAKKEMGREMLPEMVFKSFFSKLQKPQIDEGFTEIEHINFMVDGGEEKWEFWWK